MSPNFLDAGSIPTISTTNKVLVFIIKFAGSRNICEEPTVYTINDPDFVRGPPLFTMYYVYVLESQQNEKLYKGFSSDLKTRIELHNTSKVYSTLKWRPWKLIYYEACLSKTDALKREKFLKSNRGIQFLKYRLKYYFKTKKQ